MHSGITQEDSECDLHERVVRQKFSNRYSEHASRAFHEGMFEKAALFYTKAIKCYPTNSLLHSNRALAYFKLRQFNPAIADASVAIDCDSTNIKAHFILVKIHIRHGKYNEAKLILAQAHSQLTGDQTNTYNSLAQQIDAFVKEAGSVRINFTEHLPVEIVDYIVQFLDEYSLLQTEQVCRALAEQTSQEYLWKNLCLKKWSNKVVNDHTKYFSYVELPKPWKVLYFDAIRESKRKDIVDEDVLDTKWVFYSRNPGEFEGVIQFRPDHTYVSTMKGRGVIDRGTWEIKDGKEIVRHGLHNFPNIYVGRLANWGWNGQHHYALFTKVDDIVAL